MKKTIKVLCIIIIFVLLTLFFSASYSKFIIDNIAVVVAMGIDVDSDSSSKNNLKVSFQFIDASSVSESGSSETAPAVLKTVSASSISSAINLINSYVNNEITLSHCKLIVFSEEIAKKGITDDIYTLINNIQVRPTANIVISKCTAESYLENSKPLFEPLISKYYEHFVNSSLYTGYTTNATLGDIFDTMVYYACEPSAILGGINLNLQDLDNKNTATVNKEALDKSNFSSLKGSTSSENIGIAVFKDGTLVGELNAIESLAYMCISNNLKGFQISVPNPNVENAYIDVYLTPSKPSKTKVSLVNGSPYINVNCQFSGQILSMEKNANYLEASSLSKISDSCNRYLEYVFSQYLYKTSKEFKSDINGFGKNAKKLFATSEKFENYNWRDTYSDSFFNVHVKVNVKSASLISNS